MQIASGKQIGVAEGEQETGRLPDFLVIGAPRSGTTSLSKYLAAHPGAFISARKELNFFNNVEPTPEALRRYRLKFADAGPHRRAGEATPSYLASAIAVTRMAAIVPDARLVAIVRNPVDRAYSHYWFRKLWRVEHRTFGQAIDEELAGVEQEDPTANYLMFGRYYEQLVRVGEHYPQEATLVLLFDDLSDDVDTLFARLCRHIGIDDTIRPAIVGERINTTADVRWMRLWRATHPYRQRTGRRYAVTRFIDRLNSYVVKPPPMEDDLRAKLLDYFASLNVELATWLGRDLSHWMPAP